MKKKILTTILCTILLINMTGCSTKTKSKTGMEQIQKEQFLINIKLHDQARISFTFHVPYIEDSKSDYLSESLLKDTITINEFLNKLEYSNQSTDGGSILYKYNKSNKFFGNEDFFVLVCNNSDNTKDLFVAKYQKSLDNKCNMKIDDLSNVSMSIKEGTLTKQGVTVIITDTSTRRNIYGEDYKIEKKENGVWHELKPKKDIFYTAIGYMVDKNNTLELDVNWQNTYGELEAGTYRILKGASELGEGITHYLSSEFIIE